MKNKNINIFIVLLKIQEQFHHISVKIEDIKVSKIENGLFLAITSHV